VDDRIVSANTTFAFDLLAELLGDGPSENVFISPSSVAIALAMAYNGALGETRQAMAETLALGEMTLEEVNQANADLLASLKQAEPAVELAIANSLWARQGIPFVPEFLAANDEVYHAKVTELDFDDPGAVRTINAWVKDQTRGKIAEIIRAPISDLTILFLINATYFKGRWADEFDPDRTRDAPFTLLDGADKTVPMMSRDGEYPYYRGEGFQAISLPYIDKRVSMYVFLPDEDSSLAAFCAQLTAEKWDGWLQQFGEAEGYIALPRFESEYEAVLNDALSALGMEIAFDQGRADFHAMRQTTSPIWINEVRHKTFVEVNEEGTEAAAVTSVEMAEDEGEGGFYIVVNRPFCCAIRDNESGTVLFMGAIVDPQ
jgi:serpin B